MDVMRAVTASTWVVRKRWGYYVGIYDSGNGVHIEIGSYRIFIRLYMGDMPQFSLHLQIKDAGRSATQGNRQNGSRVCTCYYGKPKDTMRKLLFPMEINVMMKMRKFLSILRKMYLFWQKMRDNHMINVVFVAYIFEHATNEF